MAITEHTSQNSVGTKLNPPQDSPPQQTFEPRHLTVGECSLTDHRDPQEFVPPSHSRPTSAPYLRLAGKWLEKAGFTAGAKVRVDVSQGRLVIEPVPQFPERTPRLPRNGKKVFL
jgi:Toxin SymE, type I toxin-antitoxin system